MKTKIFLTAIICNLQLLSNNIQVNNATLTGQVPASNYTFVQFDLSWENSWRDNVNWDAAWIFVKFKASYDTTWKHASLNISGHTIPAGFTGSTTTDFKGIFIHRSANGNGNVSLTGTQLRWNYGTDGVNDGDLVEVKVFAIEMVYIPQGSFNVGDGSTDTVGQFSQGNTAAPFLISSEAALTLGGAPLTNLGNRNAIGMGFNNADDFTFTTTQTLPAVFPKGYNDFYCMKYEISQGQYTEFLNTLTRTQQQTRVASNISTDLITNIFVMSNAATVQFRNVIVCPASGNGTTAPIVFSCTRPDRACNYLNGSDGCAYMDWAGLRPMTELEFEKVCRGPLTSIADEYAWGTTNITAATTISGTENGTETITNSNANCNYNNIFFSGGDGSSHGPLRCGIFAKNATTREQSGASYYGVMEMSGSLLERPVRVGNSAGRLFDGQHGNGILNALGNADVSNWPPGLVSGNNIGSYQRGGYFGSSSVTLVRVRVSDRGETGSSRQPPSGFRGVRTSEVGTLGPNGNNTKQ
jgi:formylglycine-generating enzyme required for sulfatase activity